MRSIIKRKLSTVIQMREWFNKDVFNKVSKRYSSNFIKIVEVGPRDGLQNEKNVVNTKTKIDFINKLSETGLKCIEVTSFVSPKWVPQMADNNVVFKGINKKPGISYSALVPNLRGLDGAREVGVKEIAIFGSASETFSKKNINCSIDKSIENFKLIIEKAKEENMKIRGYISCIVGCPYEGEIKPAIAVKLASLMLDLGCYEVSLGDTIGVGTPKTIKQVLKEFQCTFSNNMNKFAIHCHDTYGRALVNIYASLECGIKVFDSSVAGLGGCPYAAGASGNVSTEDLVYFLNAEGLETGVNLNQIIEVGDYICKELRRLNHSKTGTAFLAKKNKDKLINKP